MVNTTTTWFEKYMVELEKDPQFHAEGVLLSLQDEICKAYGQPQGIYRILFWILNWSADKLIWR